MTTWYSTMFAATLAGTLATALVLALCRWESVSPSVKVWLCRAAFLKWPLGLIGVGVPIFVSGASGGQQSPNWISVLIAGVFVLWIVGAVATLIESTIDWARARRALLVVPLAPQSIVERTANWSERLGLRGAVEVRSTKDAPAAVMRAPRAAMLVPEGVSDFAIVHELAHLRHRDLAWSGVASLVAVVFWFHPWMRALDREMRLWQDVVADAKAIALTSTQPATAVDEILAATRPLSAPSLALGADASCFARRFKQLYCRGRSAWAGLAAVATVGLALVPLTSRSVDVQPSRSKVGDSDAIAAPIDSGVAAPIATMSE